MGLDFQEVTPGPDDIDGAATQGEAPEASLDNVRDTDADDATDGADLPVASQPGTVTPASENDRARRLRTFKSESRV